MKAIWICLATACGACIASSAWAENIRMAFGGPPPYVIASDNTGIAVDIVREALEAKGHTLEVVYVPNKRLVLEMELGNVDATSTVSGLEFDEDKVFLGDVIYEYTDYFFSDASKSLEINDPKDLDGLSVVAFPTAANIYVDWLAGSVKDNLYLEVGDQISQVKMLYRGRTDVVLADATIFAYLTNQYLDDTGEERRTVAQSIVVGSVDYLPGFTDAAIRDDFNEGLAEVRASGRYEAIFDSYIKPTN